MKTAICFIAILGYTCALPSLDWAKIKPKNAFVQPISNVSNSVVPRVVGGVEVVPNSKPYQVAIVVDGSHFCGGSLVSRRYVLTAGHCIEGHAYFQMILGAHNIREAESTQIVVTSVSAIVHPGYNPVNFNNDIGLIRLPSEISLNNNIQTIALAPSSSGTFEGDDALLSGWGRLSDASTAIASTLHQVQVSVITNVYCVRNYGNQVIIDSTLCTSGIGGVGGCDGDSGGPLVVGGVQIGVASFTAQSGCQAGLPTGHARITSFISWISENAEL